MDSDQLKELITKDKFLKLYNCSIITQSEVPTILAKNSMLFVLLENGKVIERKGTEFQLGHWILICCLPHVQRRKESARKIQISYIDPYGYSCSAVIKKKLQASAKTYKAKVFVNKTQIQFGIASVCGSICSYLALLRARKYSFDQIFKCKIAKSKRLLAEVIPDIISSLLSKKHNKLQRFSSDFL